LIAKDFIMPNGLAFTPDEKILYINDINRGHIRAFAVAADGTLTNGCVFTSQAPGADGMKVDMEGNVYCACRTGVMVFDHTGKLLHTYAMHDQPTNLAFGDADWKTLFITARPSLYRVRLTVPGIKVP
jgi:gluconolactonase